MTTLERLRELEKAGPSDWRPLTGMPGYVVTADGHVWSIASNWRGLGPRRLAEHPDRDGYLRVRVERNGKRNSSRVHRLVCEAFHGARANREAQIRHLNGDKLDNRAVNLAWGTAQENADDREAHGRTPHGERNAFAKLTAADIIAARHLRDRGMALSYLSAVLGVTDETLHDALAGTSYPAARNALPDLLAVVEAARRYFQRVDETRDLEDGSEAMLRWAAEEYRLENEVRAALERLDR